MDTKQPEQTAAFLLAMGRVREARDTEALRDSMADLREDLRAGKITSREARAITKAANKILQRVKQQVA